MKLRLPEALKASIEDAAKSAGRSLNAEIVVRLEASFQNQQARQVDVESIVATAVAAALDARDSTNPAKKRRA